MSFADFLEGLKKKNKEIVFDPEFSQKFKEVDGCLYSHKDLILKEMEIAYEGSPTVKKMFDEWFEEKDRIELKYKENISDANAGWGIINFDLDYAISMLYIDDYGKVRQNSLLSVLVHELTHALANTRDYPNPMLMHKDYLEIIGDLRFEHTATVYRSENLVYTEKIWQELLKNTGIEIVAQNSYIGSDTGLGNGGKVLTADYSYTGGKKIDRSVVLAFKDGTVSRDGIDNWDSSDTGYSRDLLIGNANNNTLISGDGNDFLYGMGGNDKLIGGNGADYLYGDDKDGKTTGNDTLYGGGGSDYLYGGGGDDHLFGDKDIVFDDPSIALGGRPEIISDSDNPGNDYLYGGAGNDHLHGGAGMNFLYDEEGDDTYYIGAPDAGSQKTFDFIKDSDGIGAIKLETDENIQLTGGRLVSQKSFTLGQIIDYSCFIYEDGTYRYVFTPDKRGSNTGTLSISEIAGGKPLALIQDFDKSRAETDKNGYLGIKLSGEEASEKTAPTGQNNEATKVIDGDLVRSRAASVTQTMNQVWLTTGQTGQTIEVHTGGGQDYVNGGNANDVIYLGSGNDFASGLNGDDWIEGGDGRDIIYGGLGDDYIKGGADGDLLRGDLGDDTIITGETMFEEGDSDELGDWAVGGDGDDQIYGSAARDFLNGGSGEDIIYGNGGDDVILGDGDYLFRWSPKFVSLVKIETIPGYWDDMGFWHDPINIETAGGTEHRLNADGTDWVTKATATGSINDPNSYNWTLEAKKATEHEHIFDFEAVHKFWFAGNVPKRLADNGGNDFIDGGAGNDWIAGQTGSDIIYGGAGNDIIYGDDIKGHAGDGHDIIDGGEGDDTIVGGGGNDIILGGGDNDIIYGDYTSANDLFGGDVIDGGEGNDLIYGGGGDDYIDGGEGDDIIYGDYADSETHQNDGNDILIGGLGRDVMYGGEGHDVMYSDKVVGVNQIEGDGQADLMYGGAGDDIMYAGTGGDQLFGEAGDDTLIAGESVGGTFSGGEGDDTLIIGAGHDNKFWGGAGKNTYVVSHESLAAGAGSDILSDADGNWKLTIDGQTLNSGNVTAVAENKWRLGNVEIMVSGSNLIIYAVTINADGTANKIGKQLIFQNAAGQNGFSDLNLPGYNPEEPEENQAPVISGSITDQSGQAGQLISFVIPASMFSDPDGDPLSFRLTLGNGSALPSWLTFNPDTMTVSGTAPEAFNDTLKLTASDGRGGEVSTEFGLSIALQENRAPEISGSLSDRNFAVSQQLSIPLPGGLFTDPDGDALTYRATLADGQALPSWLNFDAATGTFSGTPPVSLAGQSMFLKLWASDGQYESAALTFKVNFNPASDLNLIIGTEGDDILNGTSKAEEIRGLGGNDKLYGGAGDDVLDGGSGDDYLEGGAGNDTYVFGKGYGHDTVFAYDGTNTRREVIRLAGLNADDVEIGTVQRKVGNTVYNDMVIRIKETGETMTIDRGMDSNSSFWINAVEFGDGTVWERSQYLANLKGTDGDDTLTINTPGTLDGGEGNDTIYGSSGNDSLYGGAGDDTLYGNAGDDILDGGSGNDRLEGGAGNDTYVFGKGYGHDTVLAYDGAAGRREVIRLAGLNTDEVEIGTVQRTSGNTVYNDLVIRIKETGETMTVERGMDTNSSWWINAVEFGDGTVWERAEYLTHLYGTDEGETLTINTPGTLDGKGGDDVINGSGGNDILYGGAGNDTLYGNAGDDILDGGSGNDRLEGGAGNDTYVFGKGYGHDTVLAYDGAAGRREVIRLVGLNTGDVEIGTVQRTSGNTVYNDLVIRIKETGETMTVERGMDTNGSWWINAVEFGDGTVWERAEYLTHLYGTDEGETLTLNSPGTLDGKGGDDVINGSSGSDILYGGAGDDELYGNAGDDILDGGSGNDYLAGGAGNDTYVFGKGYGHDTVYAYDGASGRREMIRLVGLNSDEVEIGTVQRKEGNSFYNDMVIRIKDTGETMTVRNGMESNRAFWINAVEFGDGTVWERDQYMTHLYGTDEDETLTINTPGTLDGQGGDDVINGSSGNDTLYGGAGDDKLYGNAGDDILDGGSGDDYLAGGAGNDTYIFGKGYGYDTVYAYDGSSTRREMIRLVGLNSDEVEIGTVQRKEGYSVYNDLVIRIKETGETMTVRNGMETNSAFWINAVEFGDGTIWERAEYMQHLYGTEGDDVLTINSPGTLDGKGGNDVINGSAGHDTLYGGAGNDKLYGNAGNDILDGGSGNDHLEGGAGDDTYIFRAGSGQDTINNYDNTIGDDVLKMADIGAETLWFERSGNNLVINLIGTEDKVTVNNWYTNNYFKIGLIEAGDSALVYNQVDQMVQAMAALGAPGAADGGWTDEQRDALNPILTTYWQPRV